MPPRLSDALLHPIGTAASFVQRQGASWLERGRNFAAAFQNFPIGPDHYVDPPHSDYHMPAGTNVHPVNPFSRFHNTGDVVVSVNGNGDRAQLPAEELHELARNRREPLDPDEMQTIGGFLHLERKMSRERALQIMSAVNSPDTSENPFRSTDNPEMATRATIAAAIKLRETDFFDTADRLPEFLYRVRLMIMEAMIGDHKYSFPQESNTYRPVVSALIAKPNSTPVALDTVA